MQVVVVVVVTELETKVCETVAGGRRFGRHHAPSQDDPWSTPTMRWQLVAAIVVRRSARGGSGGWLTVV